MAARRSSAERPVVASLLGWDARPALPVPGSGESGGAAQPKPARGAFGRVG